MANNLSKTELEKLLFHLKDMFYIYLESDVADTTEDRIQKLYTVNQTEKILKKS